jgi:hypothetical protein
LEGGSPSGLMEGAAAFRCFSADGFSNIPWKEQAILSSTNGSFNFCKVFHRAVLKIPPSQRLPRSTNFYSGSPAKVRHCRALRMLHFLSAFVRILLQDSFCERNTEAAEKRIIHQGAL